MIFLKQRYKKVFYLLLFGLMAVSLPSCIMASPESSVVDGFSSAFTGSGYSGAGVPFSGIQSPEIRYISVSSHFQSVENNSNSFPIYAAVMLIGLSLICFTIAFWEQFLPQILSFYSNTEKSCLVEVSKVHSGIADPRTLVLLPFFGLIVFCIWTGSTQATLLRQ